MIFTIMFWEPLHLLYKPFKIIIIKSFDEEYLSHLFLNFHPWWLAFLAQEIITQLLMNLSHLKGQKKNILAAVPSVLYCANMQIRMILQLTISLECTHGTRKGAVRAWGQGNISKGKEGRRRMLGRGCSRAPHYNEKYYPEGPIKRGFSPLSFLSAQIVFSCPGFCLVSLRHVFLLDSWRYLYVSLAGKELKGSLAFALYLTHCNSPCAPSFSCATTTAFASSFSLHLRCCAGCCHPLMQQVSKEKVGSNYNGKLKITFKLYPSIWEN